MSKEGFNNEDNLLNALNLKKFSDLNSNLKNFIQFMFNNSINNTDKIKCVKKAGQDKCDLVVTVKYITHSISIKSGTGNSVHQEPIEGFIKFLKETYIFDKSLANDIRFFIWGDDTLDGSGKINKRMSAVQIKKLHPELISRLQSFFDEHKVDLIKRFVISGQKSFNMPEFIYYGTVKSGFWERSEKILNWLAHDENDSKGALSIGKLTFQAWNRNINGGNKSEKKRGVIQLKWGSVGKDLKVIMKKNE